MTGHPYILLFCRENFLLLVCEHFRAHEMRSQLEVTETLKYKVTLLCSSEFSEKPLAAQKMWSVCGFLITMSRKEARWWWTWTWTYSPQQQALVLLSVSIDNNISDVGVVINDYHCHLRGEGGGVFIKELQESHVGHACNNCNGSTISIYHEQKTSA